jgi:hypothetical protein
MSTLVQSAPKTLAPQQISLLVSLQFAKRFVAHTQITQMPVLCAE